MNRCYIQNRKSRTPYSSSLIICMMEIADLRGKGAGKDMAAIGSRSEVGEADAGEGLHWDLVA